MGKIFCLTGKSASGKDAIYTRLLGDKSLGLKPYVGYTTRPMRSGEQNGVEYFFTAKEELDAFEAAGKLIEKRVYHTVYGDWFYYSVDSENTDLSSDDYLYIGTLESFINLRDYYGKDRVIPVYIEVEDGLRLMRAIKREQQQKDPGYKEMCRRFLLDSEDFSEEKLTKAGITKRFENEDLAVCINEVSEYIRAQKKAE